MSRRPAWPDVVVLAGGDPLPASLLADVAEVIDNASLTVAADAGLHHAHRADREVDVLIGDLDSVDPEALEQARRAGTDVRSYPVDKDATDLALALDLVLERTAGAGAGAGAGARAGAERPVVLVIGGHGGRTDHLVANLLLLAAERHAPLRIHAWWGIMPSGGDWAPPGASPACAPTSPTAWTCPTTTCWRGSRTMSG